MNKPHIFNRFLAPGFAALALFSSPFVTEAQTAYQQSNLVSDIPGLANRTDPNLVNPWGISFSPTSPMWVSNAGTGTSTLYATGGVPQAMVVTVPNPAGGLASPTGQVFNGGTAFNSDRFLFATEEGTIAGWRGGLGTTAETLLNRSSFGAIYKGLAISTIATSTYVYAADFHNNHIDILASGGAPALSGSFIDPTLPAGFAAFNIQNLAGKLYVTYAMQDADAEDDVAGPGLGYVSIFDLNGVFQQRLISGGALNAPWGVALAPAGFGPLGGDLLVGNFGDGRINAYNPLTGTFVDTLRDSTGNPLVNRGLWGITFGNGGNGGDLNTLYFAAGIQREEHGLFGSIGAVPEPATYGIAGALALAGAVLWRRRRKG